MSQKTELNLNSDFSPERLVLIELEARRLRNQYLGAAVRRGFNQLKSLIADRGTAVPHDGAMTRGA